MSKESFGPKLIDFQNQRLTISTMLGSSFVNEIEFGLPEGISLSEAQIHHTNAIQNVRDFLQENPLHRVVGVALNPNSTLSPKAQLAEALENTNNLTASIPIVSPARLSNPNTAIVILGTSNISSEKRRRLVKYVESLHAKRNFYSPLVSLE